MKMMVRRTKALAIASWAFSNVMETFLKLRPHATAEMHFTVKAVLSSNFSSIGLMDVKKLAIYRRALLEVISIANL
jgi:hypothetical protein